MQTAWVSGQFVNEQGVPIEGCIQFIPSRLWIEEGEDWYPPLSPHVDLDHGRFAVQVTCTDDTEFGDWHYSVVCPVGTWSIYVSGPEQKNLSELLPERFRRS